MKSSATLVSPALPPGFVWIFRFDAAGRPESLASMAAPDLQRVDEGFYWLHLNLADTRARTWIERAALPDDVKTGLIEKAAHQHVETSKDFIWGCFADETREFDRTSGGFDFFHFALSERFIITGRRHPLHSVEMTRNALNAGQCIRGTAELFETIAGHAVSAVAAHVTDISKGLEEIEDRVLDDEVHDERKRLGPLRRRAVKLHRQLSGLQSMLRRLEETSEEEASDDIRDCAAHLLQRVDSLHLEIRSAQERARLLQDEITGKIAGETNRHLFVLTMLTTLVLPPTVVAGFFGMNTKNLVFAESENGTLFAALLCVLSSGIAYWIMRRGGMLR